MFSNSIRLLENGKKELSSIFLSNVTSHGMDRLRMVILFHEVSAAIHLFLLLRSF